MYFSSSYSYVTYCKGAITRGGVENFPKYLKGDHDKKGDWKIVLKNVKKTHKMHEKDTIVGVTNLHLFIFHTQFWTKT